MLQVFNKKALQRLLLFGLFLAGTSTTFYGQSVRSIEDYSYRLGGDTLGMQPGEDDSLVVEDGQFTGSVPSGCSWNSNFTDVYAKGFIALGVDHSITTDADSAFQYDFELALEYYDSNCTAYYDTIIMRVENDPDTGMTYQDFSVYKLPEAYWLQVKILSIHELLTNSYPSDVTDNLFLEGRLEIERYYDFSTTYTLGAGNFDIDYASSAAAYIITWDEIPGAIAYDLEWLYVDDYDITPSGSPTVVPATQLQYNFRHNATRVRLENQPGGLERRYEVSKVFEQGYLLFRIRAIGRSGPGARYEVSGAWSPSGLSTDIVNDYTLDFQHYVNSSEAHEADDKNWTYVATYAENGKKKEVTSYFDGSNKNRQSVTRLSTADRSVVAETIYDFEGRPAVQPLPVPTADSVLKYYENFNLVDSSGQVIPYHARHFDGQNGLPMSTDSGSSRYYSPNNNTGGIHRDYIPDAQKYPFAQTEYMNDQTGRVKRQSGVGPDHQLGSGHETEYMYASPSQKQLDRLFGSEVGFAGHYKEQVVVDPNGQMTLTYLDQHGRVIATGLAGESPSNLQSLNSNTGPTPFTEDLADNLKNQPIPWGMQLNYPYISKAGGTHSFWYEFQPESYQVPCMTGVCYDCVYRLEISITDDEGTEMIPGGAIDTVVGPLNQIDDPCTGNDYFTLWQQSASELDVVLPVGKYTVSKKLTIDQEAMLYYKQVYLEDTSCVKDLDYFVELAFNSTQTCDSVYYTPETGGTDRCDAFYELLAADVSPHGQYGAILDRDGNPFTDFASVNDTFPDTLGYFGLSDSAFDMSVFNIDNLLPDSMFASWRFPAVPYRDSAGALDSIYDPIAQKLVAPEKVTELKTFLSNWKDSWAASLIQFHPEYYHYSLLCETLEPAISFEERLLETETFAEAKAKGYITAINDHALADLDPLFKNSTTNSLADSVKNVIQPLQASDLSTLKNKVLNYATIAGTNYSMFQLAAATARCGSITGTELSDTLFFQACMLGTSFWDFDMEEEDQDKQWQMYRSLYLSIREELAKETFITTIDSGYKRSNACIGNTTGTCGYLHYFTVSSLDYYLYKGKEPRYQNAFTLFKNIGLDLSGKNDKEKIEAGEIFVDENMDSVCFAQCAGYLPYWRQRLEEECYLDSTTIANILAGFMEVCELGCDSVNPFGSSTLLAGTITTSGFTSFEDVINTYTTRDERCNEHLFNMPMKYNHKYFEGEQSVSDCICTSLSTDFDDYNGSGGSRCDSVGLTKTTLAFQSFLNEMAGADQLILAPRDTVPGTHFPSYDTLLYKYLGDPNGGVTMHSPTHQIESYMNFELLTMYIYGSGSPLDPECRVVIDSLDPNNPPVEFFGIQEAKGKGQGYHFSMGAVLQGGDTMKITGSSDCYPIGTRCFDPPRDPACEPGSFQDYLNTKYGIGVSESEIDALLYSCGIGDGFCPNYISDDLQALFDMMVMINDSNELEVDSVDHGCPDRNDYLVQYRPYRKNLIRRFHRYNNYWKTITKNRYGDTNTVFSAYIGGFCDFPPLWPDTVKQCYMSFMVKDAFDSSKVVTANIDTMYNLRYDPEWNDFIFTAKMNAGPLDTIDLAFGQCIQDPCETGGVELVSADEGKYQAGCTSTPLMTDLRLFLNKLAVDNLLTRPESNPVSMVGIPQFTTLLYQPLINNGTSEYWVEDTTGTKQRYLQMNLGQVDQDICNMMLWWDRDTSINFNDITGFESLQVSGSIMSRGFNSVKDVADLGYYFRAVVEINGTESAILEGWTSCYKLASCFKINTPESPIAIPPGLAERCEVCTDCGQLTAAVDSFYVKYPNIGVNHINYQQMLSNFLNNVLNNNLFYYEYEDFMNRCNVQARRPMKKELCSYSLAFDGEDANAAYEAVIALVEDFEDRNRVKINFNTFSVPSAGDELRMCFNLNGLRPGNYRAFLDTLQTHLIAEGVTANTANLNLQDSADYSALFLNDAVTSSCRTTLDLFIASSPQVTGHTTLVEEVYDTITTTLPKILYTIHFDNSVNQLTRVKFFNSLDSFLLGCPLTRPFRSEMVTSIDSSSATGSMCRESASIDTTCVPCLAVQLSTQDYLISNPNISASGLSAHLTEELGMDFTTYDAASNCPTCPVNDYYACTKMTGTRDTLLHFLNELASTSGLTNPTGLEPLTYFSGPLYGDDPVACQPQYMPVINDSKLEITLTDGCGFNCSLTLNNLDPDANFSFANVDTLYNFHIQRTGAGNNYRFYVTAHDAVSDSCVLLSGWSSCFLLSSCCAIEEFKRCFEPIMREPNIDTNECENERRWIAEFNGYALYDSYLDSIEYAFETAYRDSCAPAFDTETFGMSYLDQQHHYTLYYYDQAGNLVRTVPPKGATPLDMNDPLRVDSLKAHRGDAVQPRVHARHDLATYYKYNSLNEISRQQTPDGGVTRFWYDRLGRMVASQNAKQRAMDGFVYSYSLFDALGRVIEGGEVHATDSLSKDSLLVDTLIGVNDSMWFDHWIAQYPRREITRSTYDQRLNSTIDGLFAARSTEYPEIPTEFLRNRITSVLYFENDTSAYQIATHYGYDPHGNVSILIQEFPELAGLNQQYKYVHYHYDLVSGNMNELHYQPNESDQFYHRYAYDSDNRMVKTETSRDGGIWDEDAEYSYYLHSALARTELGELKVQGIDYLYSIHGWVKGVNSVTLRLARDPGSDGTVVARDGFSYSLSYYNGDYQSIAASTALATLVNSAGYFGDDTLDLFNGNIARMTTSMLPLMIEGKGVLGKQYKYDQLNRLYRGDAYIMNNTAPNSWAGITAQTGYATQYEYDGNGNILNLIRYGHKPGEELMDDLDYFYKSGTNQLLAAFDQQTNGDRYSHEQGGVEDIDSGQDTINGNYAYDAIGNLIQDEQEEIAEIHWTVNGKVSEIIRTEGSNKPNLEFRYDPMGNRTLKITKYGTTENTWNYTYYALDASGMVIAMYDKKLAISGDSLSLAAINQWIIDHPDLGSDSLAGMMQALLGSNETFKQLLVNQLLDHNMSGDLIDRYDLADLLSWYVSLGETAISGFTQTSAEFDSLMAQLVDYNRARLVNTMRHCDMIVFLQSILIEDGNHDFLNCIDFGVLTAIHGNLIGGPPPPDQITAVNDLMTMVDFHALATEMWTAHMLPTGMALLNCIPSDLMARALYRSNATMSEDHILNCILAHGYYTNDILLDFFSNHASKTVRNAGRDAVRDLGNHNLILDSIAASDDTSLVRKAGEIDNMIFNALLPELPDFSTNQYLDLIGQRWGSSFANDILSEEIGNLNFEQRLTLAEHHIYGSSRIGIRRDTTQLAEVRFATDSIRSSGSIGLDSIIATSNPGLDSIRCSRHLGYKNYELTNHLGNVLAISLDRRLYAESGGSFSHWAPDVSQANDYYPFGMMVPNRNYSRSTIMEDRVYTITSYEKDLVEHNFDSSVSGWTAPNGAVLTIGAEQLEVSTTEEGDAIFFNYSTTINSKYKFYVTLDQGDCDSVLIRVQEIPLSLKEARGVQTGTHEFEFTATTSTTRLRLLRKQLTSDGTLKFYVDHVKLVEVRDTLYNDTVQVVTRNGYRYAFNGMELDDEMKGRGSSYDFGERIHDPRIARFLSIDPLWKEYSDWSPYLFSGNTPTRFIDYEGMGPIDPMTWEERGMFGKLYGNRIIMIAAYGKVQEKESKRDSEVKWAARFIELGGLGNQQGLGALVDEFDEEEYDEFAEGHEFTDREGDAPPGLYLQTNDRRYGVVEGASETNSYDYKQYTTWANDEFDIVSVEDGIITQSVSYSQNEDGKFEIQSTTKYDVKYEERSYVAQRSNGLYYRFTVLDATVTKTTYDSDGNVTEIETAEHSGVELVNMEYVPAPSK